LVAQLDKMAGELGVALLAARAGKPGA
jgi:hypothetical protein